MHLMRFHPQIGTCTRQVNGDGPLNLQQEPDTVEDVQAFVGLIESSRPATDTQMRRIREPTARDAQLQKAMELTLQGWPKRVEKVPLQV